MTTLTAFQQEIAILYPELGGTGPDPERYASSIIVRALNFGAESLTDVVLAFYGIERVRAVAWARVNRLDAPTYREWKGRLDLPARDSIVDRVHQMWRQ
jgi:hypothetical protein